MEWCQYRYAAASSVAHLYVIVISTLLQVLFRFPKYVMLSSCQFYRMSLHMSCYAAANSFACRKNSGNRWLPLLYLKKLSKHGRLNFEKKRVTPSHETVDERKAHKHHVLKRGFVLYNHTLCSTQYYQVTIAYLQYMIVSKWTLNI